MKVIDYIMTIQYKNGNLLNDDAEILVNTVNCVGVMGKGIALEFKKRYPNMFDAYKNDCLDARVKVGKIWWWSQLSKKIACFPTKNHWRDPSKVEWIELGLKDLRYHLLPVIDDPYHEYLADSIAIPKLGCGLGGLNWEDVKPLMLKYLEDLDMDIRIYV